MRLACLTLLVVLTIGLPLFLCMPLYQDVSFYDLAARNLLRGGIHYRDVFDQGLPGMVWLHVGIRSLLGWSSEALRLVDFLILSFVIRLLVLWLRRSGLRSAACVWTAATLFGFYLATSEVCHAQRDVWMLLPATGALFLRSSQFVSLRSGRVVLLHVALRATGEGLCWGSAFWLKPFVAIPAIACWLVTAILIARTELRASRILASDGTCLLAGGLLAATPGVVWLYSSGSWPFFEQALAWNYEYYHQTSRQIISRTAFLLQEVFPWGWAHMLAVPLAISGICRALIHRASSEDRRFREQQALLGGFYLGWLLQANYLQHGFVYHIVPATLLATAVVASSRWLPGPSRLGRIVLAGFLTVAVAQHPLMNGERLALWGRCWREGGGSPELQNRLSLSREPIKPDWVALESVAGYLKRLRLGDRELTCYSFGTTPVYLRLGLEPSTRFIPPDEWIHYFPSRRDMIRADLAASPERYIVSDISYLAAHIQISGSFEESKTRRELAFRLPSEVPAAVRAQYFSSEPIVFRAGQYVVHRSLGTSRKQLRPSASLPQPAP